MKEIPQPTLHAPEFQVLLELLDKEISAANELTCQIMDKCASISFIQYGGVTGDTEPSCSMSCPTFTAALQSKIYKLSDIKHNLCKVRDHLKDIVG